MRRGACQAFTIIQRMPESYLTWRSEIGIYGYIYGSLYVVNFFVEEKKNNGRFVADFGKWIEIIALH